MLAALQDGAPSRPVAKPRGTSGAKPWLWVKLLAAVGTAGLVMAIYVGTTGAAGDAPAPDMAAAPPAAPPSSTGPTAVAQSLTAVEPSGPAKLETRSDGLAALPGMAVAAQAVAAERAASAGDGPGAAASAVVAAASPDVASAPTALQAPPASNALTPPRAGRHPPSARHAVKPSTQAAARKQPAAGAAPADPDAELVAAIMARMEGSRVASERGSSPVSSERTSSDRSSTIAALVRDCDALSDTGAALACRRRICDGYWGKAQACPRSMAPPAAAAVKSSSTAN
ncbi:MAG: hypothetical protein U1F53_17190 [Burkholderiaceae bacterium]